MAIKNGMKVKDVLTGFTGRVVGLVGYLTGCNQALVMPECEKPGEKKEGAWMDIDRLKSSMPNP